MEMENIFKSISDTITEIENEKEKKELEENQKLVNKALEGIEDLKEIVRHIMHNFENKENVRKMIDDSILELAYITKDGIKRQHVCIKNQPQWGATKYSPLFENDFVKSIYERGNLKYILSVLSDSKTDSMLIRELDGNIKKKSYQTCSIKIDSCWFDFFIKDGTPNTIGEINFMAN